MSRPVLHLSLVLLFVAGCGGDGNSGVIDGMDLGETLELDLANLAAVPGSADTWSLYTAQAEAEPVGTTWLAIAVAPAAAGSLAVAVDEEGVLVRSRLWGMEDPDAAWENYWRQFEYRRTRGLQPDSVRVPTYRDSLLLGHAHIMLDANYVIRHTMAVTGRDERPPESFYQSVAMAFDTVSTMLEPLRSHVGSAAFDDYASKAGETAEALRGLSGSGDLRDAVMDFRRQSCGSCHRLETPHGELRDASMTQMPDRLWYQVGLDVWPVPGEETVSQEVADLIRQMMETLEPGRAPAES
ncbi:MAG: hypothetical protein JJ896_06720 [Rhodothermales bacterium]|nr:hypothetical protein [Rhodothermales bacterium]MBO6779329.1 hypothetical protein [Rhodothermales bacterium]